MLPALIVSGLMLGSLWLFLSVHIKQVENFAGAMNFVMFPMFFFSSALYPLWKLREGGSESLYYVSLANPFTHAVELIRFALYGEFEPLPPRSSCGSTVVFFLLAVIGYNPQRGMMRRARSRSRRDDRPALERARSCSLYRDFAQADARSRRGSRRSRPPCAPARSRDRHLGDDAGRARRQQEQPVGEPDRFVDVVGDEEGGDRPARHQVGEFGAQALGERRIERDERLVEHQQIGLDREGARQRDAARQAERQLAREMAAMGGEPERREQRVEIGVGRLRRAEPHVLLHGAPRQQPRLLEHHAELAVVGQPHGAGVVAIEPGDDAQQRGLAAARRADQRRDRAGGEARISSSRST